MSQANYTINDADGATILAAINDVLGAIGTTNKGSTRPSTINAGMLWIDDNTPSATVWTLNLYDGSEDIALGRIDTANNAFLPPLEPITLDAANGRVGINATPGATLDAYQSGGGRVRASGGAGSGFEFNDANTRIVIPGPNIMTTYTANVPRFQIDAAGHFYFNQFASNGPGINNTLVGGAIFNDGANGIALSLSRGNQSPLFLNNNSTGGIATTYLCAGATVGSVVVTSVSTAFNTSSDRRKKTYIKPYKDSGAVIDGLNVVSHGWRGHPDHPKAIGVLAQEAHEVFPQAVSRGDDDPDRKEGDNGYIGWGVDYSKFVPLLLAEVKALRARVATLETASK